MKRLIRDEKGQLSLVLILIVIGGLIITPLLALMSTGLITGQAYENTMHMLYAADAGVEDGLWQIKNDRLGILFPNPPVPPVGYDEYAYSDYDASYKWDYDLDGGVNDKDVHVTIANVWMPKDISAPDPDTAREIAESTVLIITGNPPLAGGSQYEIKISYQWECGDPSLDVNTIGVWLPPGFEYAGNCSLEEEDYYSEPQIDAYKGSYAVVWNFASIPLEEFPGAHGPPMIKNFTFEYTGPEGQSPNNAVSWIDTSGVPGITYTWDADVKIYRVLSVAGDCEVEAYSAKIEVRKLGSAISGDYHAIGNTLMTCESAACPHYRNRLFKESSATVYEGDIPSTATIEAAWLYWSGWIEGEEEVWEEVWSDSCDNFGDWNPGNHWSIEPPFGFGDKEFEGQGGGSDLHRTLTIHISGSPTNSLDLSSYSGREVAVSWSQREWEWGFGFPPPELEPGDCLKYAFSGDGGGSWSEDFIAFCNDDPSSSFSDTIPDEYVTDRFKMRFFLDFDQFDEYVYIDDISISVSPGAPVEDAKVNWVMFNDNQITTNQWQVEPTPDAAPDSWCYSCFYDATDIVKAELSSNMTGTFTLGHVLEGTGTQLYYPSGATDGTTDYPLATPAQSSGPGGYGEQYMWSYAGWSLIIIYSSPETEGHQLYLFDTLRYVAVHTTMDFPISGFLVPDPIEDEEYAAHITCFVGDGDEHWPYDFIALLDAEPSVPSYQIPDDYKLWDGITCNHNSESSPNNVWNSQSIGVDPSGTDIDTFNITWSSGLLEPGDTSAWVILGNDSSNPMDAELIMLVYIIISFRSETTSGGIISYLIRS